jgi:hypothetical protein
LKNSRLELAVLEFLAAVVAHGTDAVALLHGALAGPVREMLLHNVALNTTTTMLVTTMTTNVTTTVLDRWRSHSAYYPIVATLRATRDDATKYVALQLLSNIVAAAAVSGAHTTSSTTATSDDVIARAQKRIELQQIGLQAFEHSLVGRYVCNTNFLVSLEHTR